jgi:protein SOK2
VSGDLFPHVSSFPLTDQKVRIPFERALDFANKEKITDLLYPLFVHNIGGLLYHPANSNRTNMVVQDSQQRRLEGGQSSRSSQGPQAPALHHHHSMHTPATSHLSQPPAPSIPPQGSGRPGLDRAHTFPTPPTSASSLIGISNQPSSYDWNGQNMGSNVQPAPQPLSTDARSMPTTPATTPPGSNLQGMPSSYPNYENSKSYYSAAPPAQTQYATQQPSLATYGQSIPGSSYVKNEMAPPSTRPSIVPAEPEHGEVKSDRYNQPNGQVGHGAAEGEAVQEHEPEYLHDHGASYNRSTYTYTANPSVGSLAAEHSQMPSGLSGSPSHQNGNEHMTPRTASGAAQQWAQGYHNTPPRAAQSSSLYNLVSDTRAAPNGETYTPTAYTPNSNAGYSASLNGPIGSNKRLRDDDERPDSREADYESKRRKTLTEPPVGGPVGGPFLGLQPVKAGGVMARRR